MDSHFWYVGDVKVSTTYKDADQVAFAVKSLAQQCHMHIGGQGIGVLKWVVTGRDEDISDAINQTHFESLEAFPWAALARGSKESLAIQVNNVEVLNEHWYDVKLKIVYVKDKYRLFSDKMERYIEAKVSLEEVM